MNKVDSCFSEIDLFISSDRNTHNISLSRKRQENRVKNISKALTQHVSSAEVRWVSAGTVRFRNPLED